jgi:hypothetical protein
MDLSNYLKHLRFIHFSIAILCFAMLFGMSADQERQLSKAIEDLDGIISITEAIRAEPELIYIHAARRARADSEQRMVSQRATEGKITARIEGVSGAPTISAMIEYPEITINPGDFYNTISTKYAYFGDKDEIVQTAVPETLGEFRTFWNEYDKEHFGYIYLRSSNPKHGDLKAYRFSSQHPATANEALDPYYDDPDPVRSRISFIEQPKSMKKVATSLHHDDKSPTATTRLLPKPPTKQQIEESNSTNPEVNLTVEGGTHGPSRSFYTIIDPYNDWKTVTLGSQTDGMILLEYSVPSRRVALKLQNFFVSLTGNQHLTGKFEKSFPFIKQTVTPAFYNLELSSVRQILEGQLKRSGRIIEVMGIKVPASAVSLWGVLALFILQLYFLLHCLEFSNRLQADHEAINTPWIGIYQNRISKALLISSLVLLPIIVSGVAAYFEIGNAQTLEQNLLSLAFFAASVLLALSTARIIFKVWGAISLTQQSDSTLSVFKPPHSILISMFLIASVVVLAIYTDQDTTHLRNEQARLKELSSKLASRETALIAKEGRLAAGEFDTSFMVHRLRKEIQAMPAHIYARMLFDNGNDSRINDSVNKAL